MRYLKLAMIGLVGVVGVGTGAPAIAADTTGPATLEAATKDPYGQYLTADNGRTVYMFTADEKNTSNCKAACAQAWPPVMTEGEPTAGGEVDEGMLGTIEREDGGTQVTYNGWPLYFFIQDADAGSVTGQDVEGFGGEWYLVGPDGKMVEHEAD